MISCFCQYEQLDIDRTSITCWNASSHEVAAEIQMHEALTLQWRQLSTQLVLKERKYNPTNITPCFRELTCETGEVQQQNGDALLVQITTGEKESREFY